MMKKISILVLVMSVVLISYSALKSSAPKNSNGIDYMKIEEVRSFPQSKIRVAYSILNPEEKALFWKKHIEDYVSSHENITPEFKSHIAKLKAFVSPDLYKSLSSPVIAAYVAEFNEEWLDEPIRTGKFSRNDLLEVATFYKMGKPESDKKSFEVRSSLASTESCQCRAAIHCPGTYPECIISDCVKGGYYCGVIGTMDCDGFCKGSL